MATPTRKKKSSRTSSEKTSSSKSKSIGKKVAVGTSDPKKVTTGKCRSSFMRLTEMVESKSGKGQVSTGILIPMSDKKTVKAIKAAIDFAAKERFGDSTKIFKSQKLKNPLKNGNAMLEDPDTKMGDELEDHYFLNAKTYRKPGVVNRQAQRIEDPDELVEILVSGYYFRFTLYFNGYEATTEEGIKIKGVQCMLNNVMFVAKGESLGGGGGDAEADFAEFAEEADDDDDEDEYDDED